MSATNSNHLSWAQSCDHNSIEGSVGPAGEKGCPGETGARGTIGPRGVEGNQGLRGEQGVSGERGVQGVAGQQGPIGDTGLKGADALNRVVSCVKTSVEGEAFVRLEVACEDGSTAYVILPEAL